MQVPRFREALGGGLVNPPLVLLPFFSGPAL